ncbi:hypothetical protein J132_04024 [Termitomyces sp. J132]|nr:hypothetical protein J132_04024 [Termitomyces sp. J132]
MYLLILASISLESSLSTSSPKKKKTVEAAVINMPVLLHKCPASRPLAAMDANSNDEDEYEKVRGYQSNNMSDFVIDDDPFVENISSDVGSSVPAISSVTAGSLLIHTADILDGSTDPTNELAEYTIMQPQYQEDFMKPSYKALPHLQKQLKVQPFGYDKYNSDGKLCYSRICMVTQHMSSENWLSVPRSSLHLSWILCPSSKNRS